VSTTDLYYEDVELGDEIGPIYREVTDAEVLQALSVWGPGTGPSRFTSMDVAKREGLSNAIVPGSMNIAILGQLVTNWSQTVILRKLDVVFRGMVPHNRPLTLKGIVTDKVLVEGVPQLDIDVVMENEEGTPLVIGKATITIPKSG